MESVEEEVVILSRSSDVHLHFDLCSYSKISILYYEFMFKVLDFVQNWDLISEKDDFWYDYIVS